MKKNKTFIGIILIIAVAPFLVNGLMAFTTPLTVKGDWLGFLGNYAGAIIGGLVAFYVAYYQIQKQIDLSQQDDKERNRSYIIAQEYVAPIDLKGIETGQNSRIIITEYYEEYKEDIKINQPGSDIYIPYYKISHRGLPEIILDCEIIVKLSDKEGNRFEIISNIGVFEKNTDIFIPLLKVGLNAVLQNKFQISYTTIKGERMVYILDIHNQKEMCYVLKGNNQTKECYSFNLKKSNWIYPNSKAK